MGCDAPTGVLRCFTGPPTTSESMMTAVDISNPGFGSAATRDHTYAAKIRIFDITEFGLGGGALRPRLALPGVVSHTGH
jgi:hypothetical protein